MSSSHMEIHLKRMESFLIIQRIALYLFGNWFWLWMLKWPILYFDMCYVFWYPKEKEKKEYCVLIIFYYWNILSSYTIMNVSFPWLDCFFSMYHVSSVDNSVTLCSRHKYTEDYYIYIKMIYLIKISKIFLKREEK